MEPKEEQSARFDFEEPREYTLPTYWQARGHAGIEGESEFFRIVVGDGIEDDAVIGAYDADYNHDGVSDTLLVQWRSSGIRLSAVSRDGTLLGSTTLQTLENSNLLGNDGVLDILSNKDSEILAQWWSGPYGIADGIEWTLVKFKLDDNGLSEVGRASCVGSYVDDLTFLKEQVNALGLSSAHIPDFDETYGGFLNTLYVDIEPTFDVVCRIAATCEHFYGPDYDSAGIRLASDYLNSADENWCDPQPMGTLRITQHPAPAPQVEPPVAEPAGTGEPVAAATYADGDPVSLTGILHYEITGYKGEEIICLILSLDEPLDAYVGIYPNESEPVSLLQVTSVDVSNLLLGQPDGAYMDLVGSHVRVSGTMKGSSKHSGAHYDENGAFVINRGCCIGDPILELA